MGVTRFLFDTLATGEEVAGFWLEDSLGCKACVIELGATLTELLVPDEKGEMRDVVLGYANAKGYLENGGYFGMVIGPNGNRIAGASFCIGDQKYTLTPNENANNLHSGLNGFDKKLWKGEEVEGSCAVRFTCEAADGESGFPGNRKVAVTYELKDGAISLTYEGVSDADTLFNMTNHSYFNLNGAGSGDILDNKLQIFARGYTPVADSASIPTGVVAPVEGTVFDFSTPRAIGERIEEKDEQLLFTGGYDHNFVVDIDYQPGVLRTIAKAYSEESGITMEVLTTCPCVQFYAGNFITTREGKGGKTYGKRHGFCLETQVEPNAANEKSFHSPFYKAGEKYVSQTVYRFGKR